MAKSYLAKGMNKYAEAARDDLQPTKIFLALDFVVIARVSSGFHLAINDQNDLKPAPTSTDEKVLVLYICSGPVPLLPLFLVTVLGFRGFEEAIASSFSDLAKPHVSMRRDNCAPPRQKYIAARAFYLTLLIIFVFAAWSLIPPWKNAGNSLYTKRTILRRDEYLLTEPSARHTTIVQRDEACRNVHTEKDKCAFVRRNCPDEEAGLFSYLQLYYCKLPKAKPLAFIILVIWLGLLFSTIGIAASDFFCVNLSTIATILGMSESMAGVTFLAFGNGSPDVFSTFAAMKTHSGSLAVGELVGAAGFITAVVAGSMALVRPFKVARKSFIRDVGFFTVAASFSMVFLADGNLHLWECIVMVGFYIFYVLTVVIWHWYLRKRWQRRILEDTARSHFHLPGTDDEAPEPFCDNDEADSGAGRSRATTRTVSTDDFAILERGGSPAPRAIAEEIDANRDRYLAEISSNMRISRPGPGERRNTINPIRPSLVGALEFRAVLSSLQKSRNIQIPINLRRYSDDPTFTAAQQPDNMSVLSNPEIDHTAVDPGNISTDILRPGLDNDRGGTIRIRAVSANDALGLRLDPGALRKSPPGVPQIDLLGPSPPGSGTTPPLGASVADEGQATGPPRLRIPSSRRDQFTSGVGLSAISPAISPRDCRDSADLLAPPGGGSMSYDQPDGAGSSHSSPITNAKSSTPKISIPRPSKSSQRSSPLSPFPPYSDDPNFVPSRTPSIRLPPPSVGSESTYHQHIFQGSEETPLRWWPYYILPAPRVLVSTLFPTLYSWKDKNPWERMLGIVAAPSVFLLAITLPIFEVEKEDEDDSSDIVGSNPGLLSLEHNRSSSNSLFPPPIDSPTDFPTDVANNIKPICKHGDHGLGSPSIKVTTSQLDGFARPTVVRSKSSQCHQQSPMTAHTAPSSPKEWNRWLVATQIFTAPWFIVLVVWANTTPSSLGPLLLPTLYSLIASLIALLFLLLFTSPDKSPRYHHLICYFGFVVAIAWISTIANEVVGVLKALGIILDISDAILGLTVFAVGNSLGDLVADITVAKLGYPVMALSACFGGPMLNILLGIGLGGCYMTIRGAERREHKHPGRPMKYKPYELEIGSTLLISGITLLVTLVGLLILVPLRSWWFDRRVGWGLVALWTASTIGNVVVEVVGWGSEQ
ncbi:MAG: hypothetical protein Q9163_005774 [Psora crenata]